MPPRILIFAALAGGRTSAAAGAACELAPPGSARPLSLTAPLAGAELRRAADRLAENLDLRPVADAIAVLSHITGLLRERPDATIVLETPTPGHLTRLLEASDLARARLDAGRPPEGTSTLAAQRSAAAPGLPAVRSAAAAGDLLRAPEVTTAGLVPGTAAPAPGEVAAARTALALVGLATLPEPLPVDPSAAAATLAAVAGTDAAARDAAPVVTATDAGAALQLTLPALPADLRAVRSGAELALQTAGVSRRVRAPASLGALTPGTIVADEEAGSLTVTFSPSPGPAA